MLAKSSESGIKWCQEEDKEPYFSRGVLELTELVMSNHIGLYVWIIALVRTARCRWSSYHLLMV